ncbi:hypothetical protein BST61_g6138 [Cercospora zeina]
MTSAHLGDWRCSAGPAQRGMALSGSQTGVYLISEANYSDRSCRVVDHDDEQSRTCQGAAIKLVALSARWASEVSV